MNYQNHEFTENSENRKVIYIFLIRELKDVSLCHPSVSQTSWLENADWIV